MNMKITDPLIQLFQAANRTNVKLIDSLSALNALADIPAELQSEQEMLREAMGIILEHQGIERCAVYLRDGNNLNLAVRVDWDHVCIVEESCACETRACIDTFELGQGIVGEVAATGNLQRHHCKRWPDIFTPCSPDMVMDKEIVDIRARPSSLLCVPVLHQATILGVLCLHHSQSDYFNFSHENFFSLFGRLIAQMLVNARMVETMEQKVQERTALLQQALDEAQDAQARLQDMAILDETTGLHNRRYFEAEVQPVISRALRYRSPVSLCVIKIDAQESVGDHCKSPEKSQLLTVLADLLKMHVREGDLLAYFGDEKFILALPETDQEGAVQFAIRTVKTLQHARASSDFLLSRLITRIGISSLDLDGGNDTRKLFCQLVQDGESALSVCDRTGKEYYCVPGNTRSEIYRTV